MNASHRQQAYPEPTLPVEQRLPPQALDVERTILGSCLVDNGCLDMVRRECEHSDFYMNAHQQVFLALCKYPTINGSTVDPGRLANMVGSEGAPVLIAELMESICTVGNLPFYISKLKERAARRAANSEINRAYDLDEPFNVPKLAKWTVENTRPDWILQEPAPFEFIVPGLLAKGIVGFLYGSGGTYKSLAALWLVLQRATAQLIGGQKWLDRFDVTLGRSILFSAEDLQIDLHHRIHNIISAMHEQRPDVPFAALQDAVIENCRIIPREKWIQDGELFVIDEDGPTGKVDKIASFISDFGADLAFLETFSRIAAIDGNDNSAAARFIGCMERVRDLTGVTEVVIDHSSKVAKLGITDAQGQNSLIGASQKLSNARWGMLFEALKRDGETDQLKIWNSKNFRCKRAESFRIAVEYPVFTLINESETKPDPNDQVIQIVKNNAGIKRRDLIEKLKGKGTAKSAAIKWCLKEEFIKKGDNGSGYYVVEE